MTRSSFTSASAAFALLLACGCTADPADDDDAGEEVVDEPPPSSYMANGYPTILEENEAYTGDGSDRRDLIHTFEMVDQHGNMVDYRQFLGFVVILDVSAEWCPPCRSAAEGAQEVYDEIQALGPVYYLNVLAQNWDGDPATEQTASDWSSDFDLDLPVLADADEAYSAQVGVASFPTFWFIRPDGEIERRSSGFGGDEQLITWAEYLLEDSEDDLRHIPGWPDITAEHDED